MRYVLNTPEVNSTKKALRLFSDQKRIESQNIRGTFKITNFRRYMWGFQVDVEIHGEIKCRIGRLSSTWYSKRAIDGLNDISIIKLNRFLRKSVFNSVQNHAKYFSIHLNHYSQISKIIWKS